MESLPREPRTCWLWVAHRESYLTEDGSDLPQLEPGATGEEGEPIWICHENTKEGDLILLYCAAPRSSIAYLLEATSDAGVLEMLYEPGEIGMRQLAFLLRASIQANPRIRELFEAVMNTADSEESDAAWQAFFSAACAEYDLPPDTVVVDDSLQGAHACSWVSRYKLARPITYRELMADSFLREHWPALRARFGGPIQEIPPSVWEHLVEVISAREPGFGQVIRELS